MVPGTGRFWTMDSFEGAQTIPVSLHKYLYGDANPANRTDPSGQTSVGVLITGAFIVAAAATVGMIYVAAKQNALGQLGRVAVAAVGTAVSGDMISEQEDTRVRPVPITTAEIGERVEEETEKERKTSFVFMHGTADRAWPNVGSLDSSREPRLRAGRGEFGPGFYTFRLDDNGYAQTSIGAAAHYARSASGNPYILVFTMPKDVYRNLKEYRTLPQTVDGAEASRYDVIVGPLSGLPPGWPNQYNFTGRGIIELQKGFRAAIPIKR